MAFIVEKNRILKTITIELTSLALRQAVYRAILNQTPTLNSVQPDFNTIMRHYDALKFHAQRLQSRSPHEDATLELSLLTNDFLLERSLFEGLGMEVFQRQHNLRANHVQDLHQRSLVTGLDEVEGWFSLGLVTDEIYSDYLLELNSKYLDLTLSGDEIALREFCEPLVRSGEIQIASNDELLLNLLHHGYLDSYMYTVDLLERIHGTSNSFDELDIPDITFDPLCVAIRLGHISTAQALINELYFFEGCVRDANHAIILNMALSPLTAAVYWNRPKIVGILVDSSPIYVESMEQAAAMAAAGGQEEILEILNTRLRMSSFRSSSSLHSTPTVPLAIGSFEPSLDLDYEMVGMGRSLSLITNYLHGISRPVQAGRVGSPVEQFVDPLLTPSSSSTIEFGNMDSSPSLEVIREHAARKEGRLGMEHSHNGVERIANLKAAPCVFEGNGHKVKRTLGQGLVIRLGDMCVRLRKYLADSKEIHPKLSLSLQRQITTCELVWESGIGAFYALTRNHAPANFAQVLSCLLVADAVSSKLSSADPMAHAR